MHCINNFLAHSDLKNCRNKLLIFFFVNVLVFFYTFISIYRSEKYKRCIRLQNFLYANCWYVSKNRVQTGKRVMNNTSIIMMFYCTRLYKLVLNCIYIYILPYLNLTHLFRSFSPLYT